MVPYLCDTMYDSSSITLEMVTSDWYAAHNAEFERWYVAYGPDSKRVPGTPLFMTLETITKWLKHS